MFDVNDLTAEDLLSHIVTLRAEEHENRYVLGELCSYAIDMGISAGQLAHNMNCTGGYVRQLVKTWQAFPGEEDRLPYSELTFNHLKIAAYTMEPKRWADYAAEHQLSTAELSKAIKGEAIVDELREADRIMRRVVQCLEAGGRGARYLREQLNELLRGGDADQIPEGEEASEAEEIANY